MAFSYSVRKVQRVEVSENLLKKKKKKRGAVSWFFLGGDCPFMGDGGRSPYFRLSFCITIRLQLIHFHSIGRCAVRLFGQSERGPLSITTSCDHKTELRENAIARL